jgi:acyl-CoA reductase-like NAD-dependent aldehyde dehydrogenase
MLHDQDLVSVQEVRQKVELAWQAFQVFQSYSQAQVDAIVEAMGAAGRAHARPLAEMAVEETGMGNVEDKVAKNLVNADLLVRSIRGVKTVGILRERPEDKVIEVGTGVGVIAAILPTTNPTSTAIYKSIVALKAGNAVVLSPHPRAKNSTCSTAALMIDAARKAGAPEGIIQCIQNPSLDGTNALMRHPKTGVILSTGGAGIVRAAYSSGKPAYGVGPGNVPVLLDTTFDVAQGVAKVVAGKKFDYGTVCSSEQVLVAENSIRGRVLEELRKQKAVLLNDAQRVAIEKTLFTHGTTVRAECVGQSPQKIARMAGFEIPADATILAAEIRGVGKDHPLSAEKLSPVLALLFVDSFDAGIDACEQVLRFGGLGHTCVIFASDDAKVRKFGLRMPAYRVLVNTSSPQGSTGVTTGLQPAMTLGCGAIAGNITSDNVGPLHLINIKRIAYAVRTPEEAFAGGGAPAPAPTVAAGIDRAALVSAVEKYLAAKGISVSGPAVSAAVSRVVPPAAPAPRPQSGDVVAGVVDGFLSRRRAPARPSPNCGIASPPSPKPAVAVPAPATVIAGVVDRFLSSSRVPAKPSPNCGCALPPAPKPPAPAPYIPAAAVVAPTAAPPPPFAAEPPKKAEVPAPQITIVDFVCEADVRTAMGQNKKIYIGPKTIVTPSARELAGRDEILVMAQR